MPELPEVETIVQALRKGGRGAPSVLGRRIMDVHVLWKRTLSIPAIPTFKKSIIGATFCEVCRRGKYIIIRMDGGSLLFHLRMSGDLRVETSHTLAGKNIPLQTHDRLVVDFEDGYRLVFNDARKFGRAWFLTDETEQLGKLGIEPFAPDLTAGIFHEMLHQRHRQLKPLLLDQTFMAGLGNIYTDEALHLAKLHPLTQSSCVTTEQANGLLKAIRQVLKEGIRRNGASIDWVYRGGDFQNHFRVYQRTGKTCEECGTSIERIVVGQRGTHYCPTCQQLEIEPQ
jgi:formamidopyrimidine-DNA glycosylase